MTLEVLFPKPIRKLQPGQPIQNIIQDGFKATQSNNNFPLKQQLTISNSGNLSSIESMPSNRDVPYSVDGYKDDELMW